MRGGRAAVQGVTHLHGCRPCLDVDPVAALIGERDLRLAAGDRGEIGGVPVGRGLPDRVGACRRELIQERINLRDAFAVGPGVVLVPRVIIARSARHLNLKGAARDGGLDYRAQDPVGVRYGHLRARQFCRVAGFDHGTIPVARTPGQNQHIAAGARQADDPVGGNPGRAGLDARRAEVGDRGPARSVTQVVEYLIAGPGWRDLNGKRRVNPAGRRFDSRLRGDKQHGGLLNRVGVPVFQLGVVNGQSPARASSVEGEPVGVGPPVAVSGLIQDVRVPIFRARQRDIQGVRGVGGIPVIGFHQGRPAGVRGAGVMRRFSVAVTRYLERGRVGQVQRSRPRGRIRIGHGAVRGVEKLDRAQIGIVIHINIDAAHVIAAGGLQGDGLVGPGHRVLRHAYQRDVGGIVDLGEQVVAGARQGERHVLWQPLQFLRAVDLDRHGAADRRLRVRRDGHLVRDIQERQFGTPRQGSWIWGAARARVLGAAEPYLIDAGLPRQDGHLV